VWAGIPLLIPLTALLLHGRAFAFIFVIPWALTLIPVILLWLPSNRPCHPSKLSAVNQDVV
jgi:hypothetical protein